VHLNSVYIHLRGGLDNLAWAMHYEFRLLGDKDERDGQTRKRCGFFTAQFLAAVDTSCPALAEILHAKHGWFNAFKELRDPVAHRIPLYAMPGVIHEDSEDAERLRRLNKESSDAFARGDFNRGRDKLFEAWTVGKYEPWFTQYAPDGYAVRDIRAQINSDLGEFLTVGEAVLLALFSTASSKTANA
jgi:hypothetical protein